jgi:hypothetical protein
LEKDWNGTTRKKKISWVKKQARGFDMEGYSL